ncbi:MAG: MFS transporter [Chloroflexota bacterium]
MRQQGSVPGAPPVAAGMTKGNKWAVLGAVGFGTYLAVVDSTIVNISLPTMTSALRTDLTTIQWVVMAYLLVITGLLLSFGRLADLVGRKPVYVAGGAVFTLGTLACGLVQTVEQLIAARVLQGIGSAMIMALGPALTASAFPPSERGKALGINSTIVALGAISGPVLGGLLQDALDWRWVFLARVPFGLLAILLAWWLLAHQPGLGRRRFDLLGGTLLFLWLAALTLGLNQGRNLGWDSPATLALFAGAAVGLTLFVLVERRAAEPMFDLNLLRVRLFTAASASSLLMFMAQFGVGLLLPFYFVQAAGYSPRDAGLMMLPLPLAMSVIAPLSGSLSDRMGSRILSTAGMALLTLGLFLLSRIEVATPYPQVALSMVVVGAGSGLFGSPNNSALLSSLPRALMGVASGMQATMRNLGMVVGTAIAGAVWTGRMAYYAEKLSRAGSLDQATVQQQAFMGGFQDALLVSAAICSLGIFTSLVRGKQHLD